MRAKSMALLMLALGCGLVASIGITQVMAKRNAEPAASSDAQPIFIALQDIPYGERLTAELLKLESWPKDKVPLGAISKIEDVEGCRTRTKLYAGEPILEKKLLGKGANMQGDSVLIPKGMRVVPVKVDNVSGGPGLIMPGDRVDVLVHLVRNASQDVQETTTRTILQDIKVFAVNDVVDVEKDKDSKDREKKTAQTISLLVTPAQAAKLTLATEMGKVRLVMRGPDDEGNALDGIAKPGDLLGDMKGKADRDLETLMVKETLSPQKKTGITDFLNSMKSQLASKATAETPAIINDTWTMRILQPNGVNELVLEADSNPQAAKMPQGGWHLVSTSLISVNGGVSTGSSNKVPSPPPSAPAASAPPAPQAGLPPAEPAAESNSDANTAPLPQENKPVDKSPVADPAPSPSAETNQAIGG